MAEDNDGVEKVDTNLLIGTPIKDHESDDEACERLAGHGITSAVVKCYACKGRTLVEKKNTNRGFSYICLGCFLEAREKIEKDGDEVLLEWANSRESMRRRPPLN